MKRNLSFSLLNEVNTKRCEDVFHPIDNWTPTDWATAMAGECGEACNQIKKLRRLDGADSYIDTPHNRNKLISKVADELADMVIYADLLATRLGIDLGASIIKKFNEVSEERGSQYTIKEDE